MKLSISKDDLLIYLLNQLTYFFPDKGIIDKKKFKKCFILALERTEFCFSHINSKYFRDDSSCIFNHLNGDNYSMFLYFLSNSLYRENASLNNCAKIFLLNKYLHSIDVFYEIELPNIFLFVHPLGTVLGRGKYSDYFMVYQKCNIGSNKDIYPTLGKYVSMHPGSAILGNCHVGNNCRLAVNSLLLDKDLKPNSLYIGNPKKFSIKEVTEINPIWITS